MKFPTMTEMAKDVAEKALDEYEYKGKTIRQWIDEIISLENKTSDWIPVTERLPEVNKKVLVTYEKLNGGTLLVGFDKRVITKGGELWQGKGNRIIAWQPSPEPYKGK